MKSLVIMLLPVIFIIVLFTDVLHSKDLERTMLVDGIERLYIIHKPKNYSGTERIPLVMVLHGGGGNAKHMVKFSGFNEISDKENFLAVYPEGYEKNWSDGRIGDELPTKRDDVKFISILLDTLIANYNIDTTRIFSTGISNGGFFSIYLAYRLSARILAVAPICANIPENYKNDFKLDHPVSMMLINGTGDKLVKYDGGPVGFKDGDRGYSISTDETIRLWVEQDGCVKSPTVEDMPNNNLSDKCKAVKETHSGGKSSTDVVLIKITGGGHTWPGGSQYLPKFLVGAICKDFKAEEVVWEFFKSRTVR
jgi:polyhydroxybutyrate depolymerase